VPTDDMELGPGGRSEVEPIFRCTSFSTPVSPFFHSLAAKPQSVPVRAIATLDALVFHVTGSKSELSGRKQFKQQS